MSHTENHGSRHFSAGADAIKLDQLASPDDTTALDASASRHGLCPKLPGDAAKMLNGLGQWTAAGGMSDYAEVRDQKTSGTAPQTINSGDWRTRDLNTKLYDPNGFVTSLSSNRFTLSRGTYIVQAHAEAYRCDASRARIWSTTRGVLLLGLCGKATFEEVLTQDVFSAETAMVTGQIEVTSDTETFELQHRVSRPGYGGFTSGWDTEVYSIVQLWRVSVGSSSSSSSSA